MSGPETPEIVVLVSIARHEKSGRPMLALNDAQALEQAKLLSDQPRVVHVGSQADEITLRQYLGLGVGQLELIEAQPGQDICDPLAAYLARLQPDLIFCGRFAAGQQDSGLVPYLLADRLNMALVDNVLACCLEGEMLEATQFQPKGRRRVLKQPLPAIVTCSDKSPFTLEYIARRARQGEIKRHTAELDKASSQTPALQPQWLVEAAKPGRKRLTIKSEKSAWDRLTSKVAVAGGGGQVVLDGSSDSKADKVLALLREKGLLQGKGSA